MQTQQNSAFRWNLGGLLGSAFGCSLWLILTPFAASWNLAGTTAALIAASIIWLSVPVLWSRRQSLDAFRGMMIFLVVAFASTCALIFYAHSMGFRFLVSYPENETVAALKSAWILLIYPALALLFWGINHNSKSQALRTKASKEDLAQHIRQRRGRMRSFVDSSDIQKGIETGRE